MTALDASFLGAESPRTPMHVGAVVVFEGAPFFDADGSFRIDAVRSRVAERLHLLPRLRRRVLPVPLELGRPFWVDDPDFDIADHVRVERLDAPGDRAALEAFADRANMELLDRHRPLWELVFVTGLDDGNVAMVEKVHHAMVDGVAGVDLASVLLDAEREVDPIDAPPWYPGTVPEPVGLVAEGLREGVRQPLDAVRWAAATAVSPSRLRSHAQGAAAVAGALVDLGLQRRRTSIGGAVGRRRRLLPVSRSLSDLEAVAHGLDATVNDVVVTAVVAGLTRLIRERGEVPPRELRVLVPVSIRSADEHGAMGNRVSAMLVSFSTHEDDPVQRLATVHRRIAALKRAHEAQGTELLLEAIELLPAPILRAVSGAIHRQPFVDLVVTNVPGVPFPLYFLGAELLESVPVVPLGGNLSVGVAALSYDGLLTLGVHADADRCPDVETFAAGIEEAIEELVAFVRPTATAPSREATPTRGAGHLANGRTPTSPPDPSSLTGPRPG